MALKNQAGLIKIIDAIECMEKSLSCAICLEISSEPVETRCGHLFCRICIQKVLSHPGESCPVCKFNLTRRSVSSSGHMGLCIQQLSKLIDAVRSDTDIDITSCLKTQYKKRVFLPSASSSSSQSQQETQNHILSSDSDNNTKKKPQNHDDLATQDSKLASKESSVEYPFHKPGEQTINNLSCKMITKKLQLEATNPLRLTAINPSPVQNENVLPPKNTSGALSKPKFATKTHQFDPKVNDKTDSSFEENRQCLKDISTLNVNRSLTDQSTKTWSRVAKFGKELRRKSGRNSPRIHKKPKLSVNVRDKTVLLNASHDHSTDRETNGQDRVHHDTDTNNSMFIRHEDDINVSGGEIKKTDGEKVNPARLNQDDEIISKNKIQGTLITINDKIGGENVALEAHVETNERHSNFGSEISGIQINKYPKKNVQEKQKLSDIFLPSDSSKIMIPVNNTDKQLSEEKRQVLEASSAPDSGKSLFLSNKGSKQSAEEKEKVSVASSAADSRKSLFSANKGSKKSLEGKEKVLDATLKTNSEKLVIPENKTSKLYEEKRRMDSDASSSDCEKLVDKANKGGKRLSEEQGKLPESLKTSAGKDTKTARIVSEKINHISDVESDRRRTKQTQFANVAENVVRFKKLGHLFRAQRKSVAFFYLGPMKTQGSEISSASICKVCSSRQLSDKSTLLQKQCLGSSGRLSRSRSFESASFNNQKLLPLPEITTNRINKGDKKEKHVQISSAPKKQTISSKNYLQFRCLSKDDRSQLASTKIAEKTLPDKSESSELSIIRRKRKRSQSSDHEDQFAEEQNAKRVSKERSESPDHEDDFTKEQNANRVSKERTESPDREDDFTEEENAKCVSDEQSALPDHEDQSTEEQNGKPVSKKQSESHDREDQCTEKQSEPRVSKKPSTSSNHEDECTKNQSRKFAPHKLIQMENDRHFRVDSRLNKTLYSQELASESPQTEELAEQKKDKSDMTYPPENENVDVERAEIDFRLNNAFEETNITLRGNIPRKLAKPTPVITPDLPKNGNCNEGRDLIGLEVCEQSRSYADVIARNSNIHEYDEGSEIDLSRASMMDITGEELLLKNFEEHLFGPRKSDNVLGNDKKRSENNKENTTDCLAVENRPLMPEPLDQSVSVPETTLVEYNQPLEMEDFVELTPTDQNLNRLNNSANIIRNKESATIRLNIEIPENCKENKTVETPLKKTRDNEKAKMHTPAQSVTKLRPMYQSTPKSCQIPTDRYQRTVYRQMKENANSPIPNLEHKDISRPLKLIPPITRRGCILCSGLTLKQSEDVRYLSSLFNMQYTKKFTADVTHIIVKTNDENNGACKTLKYLQGVAYRKWVLNFNWIVDCVMQKKLLNEELYEVVDSTTLITGPKKARTGQKGPFDGFVFHCVEPFQNISVPDYEDLLHQMGAKVVGSLNDLAAEESILKIIAVQAECHEKKIIEWHQITKAVPVAQEWIVECISQYRLVSFLPFLQELLPQDILDLGFPEELIQDDDSDFMYDMTY